MKISIKILLFLLVGDSISYNVKDIIDALNDPEYTHLDFQNVTLGNAEAVKIAGALKNTKAKSLNLKWDKLSAGVKEIAKVLTTTSITHLNLRGNEINTSEGLELGKILKSTQITVLDLGNNNLKLGLNEFKSTKITNLNLEGNPVVLTPNDLKDSKIQILNLGRTKQGDHGAVEIVGALKGTKITNLNLENNEITQTGAENISKILNETELNSLNLGFNSLGDSGVEAISRVLKGTKILALGLERVNMTGKGFEKLIQALTNGTIKYLNLGSNEIAEGSAIAKVLKNTVITNLNLHDNNLRDEGLEAIATELPNSKITTLNLNKNSITKKGAQALARVLKDTKITSLNLGSNDIGREGLESIARVLEHTEIRTLNFEGNSLGYNEIMIIANVLKDTKIKNLNLENNAIRCLEIESLASVLADTNITNLNLGNNKIGNPGVIGLAKIINETQIVTLNLNFNKKISDRGGRVVLDALRDNQVLAGLEIRGSQMSESVYNQISYRTNRNKLLMDKLYSRFRNNPSNDFVITIREKPESYIDYFTSKWDIDCTEDSVRNLVENLQIVPRKAVVPRSFVSRRDKLSTGNFVLVCLVLLLLFVVFCYAAVQLIRARRNNQNPKGYSRPGTKYAV